MEKGVQNQIIATDGTFRIKIPKGVKTTFAANYPGYAGEIREVLLRRDYYFFREQYLDLYMDLMRVDARIELSPIFFKQSTAIILEESFPGTRPIIHDPCQVAGNAYQNRGPHRQHRKSRRPGATLRRTS
jgi:hypothetical protein